MHGRFLPLLAVPLLLVSSGLYAQDLPIQNVRFPSGISVRTGFGRYSVHDEYISDEKYSGTLPWLSASWTRLHERGGYRIELEHRRSPEIRNHNISSTITQFSLNLDFLHRVATPSLFSRSAYVFLGPSTEIFLYGNEQNIAEGGLDLVLSVAALVSAGVNAGVVFPLGDRIQATASLRSTLLSMGLRMVDMMEDDESPFRFLTLPSGANASTNLGLRYYLLDRLSLEVGYELQLLRISAWDYLLSASDNLTVGFTVGL